MILWCASIWSGQRLRRILSVTLLQDEDISQRKVHAFDVFAVTNVTGPDESRLFRSRKRFRVNARVRCSCRFLLLDDFPNFQQRFLVDLELADAVGVSDGVAPLPSAMGCGRCWGR
jgi:hypothetical protein